MEKVTRRRLTRAELEQSLLPCPFCESDDLVLVESDNASGTIRHSYVECEDCYAKGSLEPTTAEAAAKWNIPVRSPRDSVSATADIEHGNAHYDDDDQASGETNWAWWASRPDHQRDLELARRGDLTELTAEQLIDAMRALSKNSTINEWFGTGKQTLERKRHDEIRALLRDKFGVDAQICKYYTDVDVTYGVEPFDD